MYSEKMEALIKAALADGVLTEKEKQILFKRAQAEGIDLDEFEMILDARLIELKKVQKSSAPKSDKFGDVRKCPACGQGDRRRRSGNRNGAGRCGRSKGGNRCRRGSGRKGGRAGLCPCDRPSPY